MQVNVSQFKIPGKDNRPMAVDVHYPQNQSPKAVIVYAHGINGFKDWGDMNEIASDFAEAGYAFLKFNYSHNGTTPEQPVDFVDMEAYSRDNYSIRQYDLSKVIDYISESKEHYLPAQNIVLIGHSRGGTDIILYGSNDSRVKALISWAAPSQANTPFGKWSAEDIEQWKNEGVKTIRNSRTGQDLPIGWQLYEDCKENKARLNVESAARSMNKPWLIVHGEEDEAVFVKDAYDLKSWQPEARVKIIPETGHTFDRKHPADHQRPAAAQKLIDASLNFLKENI